MCISTETLKEVEKTLTDSKSITNNPMPLLKGCFPDLTFVRLSASDIDEPPFRALDDYNLYLLDTSEHCVKITSNPSMASAIVVAQRA